MKTIGKIVRWIMGVLFILFGLIFVAISFLSCVLWVASGLLLLPPIVNRIPEFKHKKGMLIGGSIIMFFMAFVFVPEYEQSETVLVEGTADEMSQPESTALPKETSQQESTAQMDEVLQQEKEDQPVSNTTPKEDAEEKIDEKELAGWIEDKLSQRESVTDKERKKWEKVKEETFLPLWQDTVLKEVESYGDNYDSMIEYMERAETLYEELYGSGENQISSIKQVVKDLSDMLDENKNLKWKYGDDLETINLNCQFAEFYITQRLEQNYSDNILGRLQKEYDSYQTQYTSDWVAYDVEYIWDTPTAGDTFRIIHADSQNPFTQQGVYEVAYYDTGSTTKISNSGGFVQEVPVYQLIENVTELQADIDEYFTNLGLCADRYNALKQALGAGASKSVGQNVPQYLEEEGLGNGDFFVGEWVDANSEWLFMEITNGYDGRYKIEISDRLSSSEFINWSFVGVYDPSIDGLVYSGGERWDIDQLERTLTYNDGSGAFLRGEDELFTWRDDKENYGEFSCFTAAE
ncbi:MAG: hypothetical protein K2M91_13790 [Lachnospiraceae bacterium]|nr:hypothetical protein [Lachnospiraceae bacterium]